MEKITITRNRLGGVKTADRMPTIAEFDQGNLVHNENVRKMMAMFAEMLIERGTLHGITKTQEPYHSMFYREFCSAVNNKTDISDGEWMKLYCMHERYLLDKRCPSDVNLIDVIEMIADSVCADMAQKGKAEDVTIDVDILQQAVANTTKILADIVEPVKQGRNQTYDTMGNLIAMNEEILSSELSHFYE